MAAGQACDTTNTESPLADLMTLDSMQLSATQSLLLPLGIIFDILNSGKSFKLTMVSANWARLPFFHGPAYLPVPQAYNLDRWAERYSFEKLLSLFFESSLFSTESILRKIHGAK